MKYKTMLVTGGAGFIGSNFIEYMLKKHKNCFIVCFDALTYAGNKKNLTECLKCKNFKFVRGNIADEKSVDRVFKKYNFDCVVNFAAESHVARSITNPILFLKTNVIGVQVLLNACTKYKVKKFHQISTDEVYGEMKRTENKKYSELDSLCPTNPYACSKASADLLIMSYAKNFKLDVTISRASNNYGEKQYVEKLIPIIITSCIKNKKIPILGQGNNVRNWIYVKDHCKAIDLILEKGRANEIYNVGSEDEFANIDVAKNVVKNFNKPKQEFEYFENRIGEDEKYSLNCSKIKNELGFEATTKFEDGIKKTIEWYEQNECWWKNAK